MRVGLSRIPSVLDLREAYERLQFSERLKPSALALFSQWARFDARLAEIWVVRIVRCWQSLSAFELRKELFKQPWPSAVGPLIEFTQLALSRDEEKLPLFIKWKELLTYGMTKADAEQFFIGQRRIGSRAMFDDARLSLREYRRWGYLSREILFNKASAIKQFKTHSYEFETRIEILKDLLSQNSRITTRDYWIALGKSLSFRQAERDLRRSGLVKPRGGKTKSRYFVAA